MQPLFTAERIRGRVTELATLIHRDHPDGVHLVGVLKGSFVFLADLMRALPGPATIDFVAVTSYGNQTTSSHRVQMLKDLDHSVSGRDVVLVEDIVDTGVTLSYLLNLLGSRKPRALRTACLLSKPSRLEVPVRLDYVGFRIADDFVVGYGLDHAEAHRSLPYIAVIDLPHRLKSRDTPG
jgi:hypoxanthine phosphoribosyltransferase